MNQRRRNRLLNWLLAFFLASLINDSATHSRASHRNEPERSKAVVRDGSLTLISEDGIHMTTRLQYADGTVEWVGFRSKHMTPIGPGEIDTSDHSDRIRLYVMLPVNSEQLRAAKADVVSDFRDSTYRLNNNNCVRFASRLASKCGYHLKDAFDVGKTPEEVVRLFAKTYRDEVTFDVRPFPWSAPAESSGSSDEMNDNRRRLRVQLDWIQCHKPETIFGDDRVYVRVYEDNRLVYETPKRKSMGRGDRKTMNTDLVTVSAGTTLSIQLWDDDTLDRDDLIFDQPVTITTAETLTFRQDRGEPTLGSASTYEIQLTCADL